MKTVNFKYVARRYRETKLSTLTDVEYVLALLQECVRQIRLCDEAVQAVNQELLYDCTTKAQQLLFELMTTADRRTEAGERLMAFYAYLNQCLYEVQFKKNIERLEEVKQYLQEMIASWEIAQQKSRQQNYTSEWI